MQSGRKRTRGGGALRGRRGIPAVVTSERWAPLLYPHKVWITKSLWELTWDG